jgi:hypothetical protein
MYLLIFFLGAAVVMLIWLLYAWISKRRVKLSFLSWCGIAITIILAFFTAAWSTSSLIEGENRAAGVGLLLFGGLTLIILGLTRIKITKDKHKK